MGGWLEWIIDILANAYKWSKRDILRDVYLDEALIYIDLIKRRNLQDRLLELAIISNPHTKNPKELHTFLSNELRSLEGGNIMDLEREKNATEKIKNIFKNAGNFK